jgi:hypothetical protein
MITKNKLVHGVGLNDYDGPVKINYVHILSYDRWKQMLGRCYSDKWQTSHPTYIGCSVCEEWKIFSVFKQWFDENYIEGFELDKDILVEGNKIYGPNTCRFIPNYLNTILNDCRSSRGDFPMGVYECKPNKGNGTITTKYRARCSNAHGKRLTKVFKTIPEAQSWYSATKHQIVKERAIEAFLAGEIMSDVASALINRKF